MAGSLGPRSYFVEFDRATFANYQWPEDMLNNFENELERKVKLLALIKGQVVMPASHLLESELARDFIKVYPEAITRGILVPALRDDVGDARSFLAMKRASDENRWYEDSAADLVAALIDGYARPLRWNVEQASGWMRDRLLSDLADPGSVLRVRAGRVTDAQAAEISGRIRDLSVVSRAGLLRSVRAVVERLPVVHIDDPFDEYIDFLYYLSGAISVGAEGVLPQENLVRFDITTPTLRTERLSEYEIFYRMFLLVVRTHTQCLLYEGVLDSLSLKDIADLRETPAHAEFVEKYDALLLQARRSAPIRDSSGLVLHLEELEELEWDLRQTFTQTVAREVRAQSQAQALQAEEAALLGNLGSLLTFYDAEEHVQEVAANGLVSSRPDRLTRQLIERTQLLLARMHQILDSRSLCDREVLLNFLERVQQRYRGAPALP